MHRLVWTGPRDSRPEGLQARRWLKKLEASIQTQPKSHLAGLNRCNNKYETSRSEFEKSLKPHRSRPGWSASVGGIIQFAAQVCALSAPARPLYETPYTSNLKPNNQRTTPYKKIRVSCLGLRAQLAWKGSTPCTRSAAPEARPLGSAGPSGAWAWKTKNTLNPTF